MFSISCHFILNVQCSRMVDISEQIKVTIFSEKNNSVH